MSNLHSSYKMSFALGGLFLNESLDVARLHIASTSWPETLLRALKAGIVKLPKEASQRRTLREIINRLSTLSTNEIVYLTNFAGRADQQALLWLATCRAYRFVREFATDVLQDRYLSFQLDVPIESFDHFFEAKAEWSDELASISPSTQRKLRQVLFRIMREAHILTESNRMQKAYLSPTLRTLIAAENPSELSVFPGLMNEDV